MLVKINMAMLMGAFFNKFMGMGGKYKIAIYNKIKKYFFGSQGGPV